jgi:hypothetical protein
MSEFSDKMEEFEKKGKHSNRGIKRIILLGLLVFAGLYLYSVRLGRQKQVVAAQKEEVIKEKFQDSLVLIEQQTMLLKEEELIRELSRVQGELKKIKKEAATNPELAREIAKLHIGYDTREPTRIDYYQRLKDGGTIIDILDTTKEFNVDLRTVEVYGDTGKNAVNTMYVGKNVDKAIVEILQKRFNEKGIKLKLAEFVSGKGFEWKKSAIEIGFEPTPDGLNKNANTYVRIYSYAPKPRIKKMIADKFGAKGFQVRVFPDWEKKPSFFSDRTTILYYDKANAVKANIMAKWLAKLTSVSFSTKMGNGLGVSAEDRKDLFIIHYNGKSN